MSSNELDRLREEVIEKIKQAFPKASRPKPIVRNRSNYFGKVLIEMLQKKDWIEIVSHPNLIYILSEVDALWEITDRAYIYYLPAFLIATMNDPGAWIMYDTTLSQIRMVASSLSITKLEAIAAWLEYHVETIESDKHNYPKRTLEDTLLRILILLDEKRSKTPM